MGKFDENNLDLIKLDLLNKNDVEKLLTDLKVNKIINLSGQALFIILFKILMSIKI